MNRLRQYEELLRKNNIAIEPADHIDPEGASTDIESGSSNSMCQTCSNNLADATGEPSDVAKNIKSESQTLAEAK
jgi:hypothetical protein